jgi:hypothetical protein
MTWNIMWVNAQSVKRPESYNYQRGLEALQDEKRQEALDFFNKDLKEARWPYVMGTMYQHEKQYKKAVDVHL